VWVYLCKGKGVDEIITRIVKLSIMYVLGFRLRVVGDEC
jgi:hypothetical protein